MSSQGVFYIVGSQRSGTTLMRLMLGSHPDIHCFDEQYSYDILRGGKKSAALEGGEKFSGFKIPRWTESLDLAQIPDMKSCAGTPRFYDGEPILFLIRSPLDVVASMLALQVQGKSWLEVYGMDDVRRKVSTSDDFRQRYAKDIAYIDTHSSLAGVGALLWKHKVAAFSKYQQSGFPVMKVIYEQLVAESESSLRKILQHLSCRWDPAVLNHHQISHPETSPHGLTHGQTDTRRKVSDSSVGRWQQVLTQQDIDSIRFITGEMEEIFSQEAPG